MGQPPPRGIVVGIFEVQSTHQTSEKEITATLRGESGIAVLELPKETQEYIKKGKKVTLSVTEYSDK